MQPMIEATFIKKGDNNISYSIIVNENFSFDAEGCEHEGMKAYFSYDETAPTSIILGINTITVRNYGAEVHPPFPWPKHTGVSLDTWLEKVMGLLRKINSAYAQDVL